MLFRRIVVIALLAGLAGGLALSLVQRWQVIPIITAAEQLESQKVEVAGSEESDHSGHSHDHDHDHGDGEHPEGCPHEPPPEAAELPGGVGAGHGSPR